MIFAKNLPAAEVGVKESVRMDDFCRNLRIFVR